MASNSTQLITDLNSVASNGSTATTKANAIAAAGPIVDYPGTVESCAVDLSNLKQRIAVLISVTDAGDATNLALLQGINQVLV